MQVVHVIATLAAAHGGPSRACVDMARALAARGHGVAIETTSIAMTPADAAALDTLRSEGVAVRCHPPGWPRRWARAPGLAVAVTEAARHADVVHAHALYLHHGFAAWRACRDTGAALVLTPHGGLSAHVRTRRRMRKTVANWLFQDRMLAEAAAIHCLDQAEAAELAALGHGARVCVVPPMIGADASGVPRGRFRARFGIGAERPLVLFLGRLAPGKGVGALARAFAHAAARHPDAVLALAGPDFGAAGEARVPADAAGVGDRVILTGALDRQGCAEALADADVYVLLSEGESFGLAALEAMAAGVPVLLSPQVPIAAAAVAAGAGLAVRAEDAGAALDRLLADGDMRAEMGAAGRTHARARHGPEASVARLESLYARAAARGQVRHAA